MIRLLLDEDLLKGAIKPELVLERHPKSPLEGRSDHGKGRDDMHLFFDQDLGDSWYAGLMFATLLL